MQLRTEIEIARAPPAVWAVLVDLPRYAEWNPFIVAAEGRLEAGACLRMVVSTEGSERSYRPEVVALRPEHELRLQARLWLHGFFDQEHFCLLQALGEDHTRFVQGQNVEGLLARWSGPRLTRLTRGMIGMNQALKKRCERE